MAVLLKTSGFRGLTFDRVVSLLCMESCGGQGMRLRPLDAGRDGGRSVARFPVPGKSMSNAFLPADGASDWELQRSVIEAAQGGDLEALGSLYDSHINQVYRYTLARLGNVHDAEE